MNLSILDFGPVGEAVSLMTEADRSGYQRYAECAARLPEIARRFAVDKIMILLRSYGEGSHETCRALALHAGLTPRRAAD